MNNYKQQLCKFYQINGQCPNLDKCVFIHQQLEIHQQVQQLKPLPLYYDFSLIKKEQDQRQICKYNLKNLCKFGDSCINWHQDNSSNNSVDQRNNSQNSHNSSIKSRNNSSNSINDSFTYPNKINRLNLFDQKKQTYDNKQLLHNQPNYEQRQNYHQQQLQNQIQFQNNSIQLPQQGFTQNTLQGFQQQQIKKDQSININQEHQFINTIQQINCKITSYQLQLIIYNLDELNIKENYSKLQQANHLWQQDKLPECSSLLSDIMFSKYSQKEHHKIYQQILNEAHQLARDFWAQIQSSYEKPVEYYNNQQYHCM